MDLVISYAIPPSLFSIILEGSVFSILATLGACIKNKYILVFIIGSFLHVVSEYSGIHVYFRQHNCINL